jgi:hypothetical protein
MLTSQQYTRMNYRTQVNYRVLSQPVRLRAPHVKLPRRDGWRLVAEAFLIGRDLVLLAWTLVVLAFWLAIIVGLLL